MPGLVIKNWPVSFLTNLNHLCTQVLGVHKNLDVYIGECFLNLLAPVTISNSSQTDILEKSTDQKLGCCKNVKLILEAFSQFLYSSRCGHLTPVCGQCSEEHCPG